MWKIDYRPYHLPFRAVVRTAHGSWAEREGFLLRMSALGEHAGATGNSAGWGEVAPIPWFGTETWAEAGTALAGLRGEARDLADALARVPGEYGCVRAGLAAAWAGLGGGDGEADAGGGGAETVKFLPVAGLLPAGRAVLAAVVGRLESGFRTFKWKVGVGDAADELRILDDLLGELPAGAKLRLDANGAWDRRVAERWLAAAAERPAIEYIEQPIGPEARGAEDTLRGLAEDYPVAIALDESLSGARDVERWLAADWRGVWVLKPSLLGEPGPVLARLARAEADVVFGSALETVVGARAGLALAFAWEERRAKPAAERRALGHGVWPLFAEARANAPTSGPFVRREDWERIDAEALWNALS
ncbi:MAG: o-succinylbenzoate synthase [Verrucomicrobia bacterium]|nr:o-succinylbenzoate synthase [Verrucomicrobiota bacterium]